MSTVSISIILLVTLFVLLGGGLWVAFALLGVGVLGLQLFTSAPVGLALANSAWSSASAWSLAPLPLFIWMGEILYHSRISHDMYTGLAPWTNRLPGGLVHTNVLGCAVFAAVSGSSAATTATIGRISIPELRSRGYPDSVVLGSLAGAGTLGLLIPPSITLIVYGVSADLSIGRLFIAGILPGFMLAFLFMGYIAVWAVFNKSQLPPPEPALPFAERIRRGRRLIPVVLLIAGVIGSIYGGYATPTEAAVVGVLGSLLLSGLSGTLTWHSFTSSVATATHTSCMIVFIVVGASFLTVTMAYTGVPRYLAELIAQLGLSAYALIAVLTVFFVILGMFIDGISIVVLTASILLPMVQAVGIDLIWFGIFLVVVVEMAMVTPPVGFNLFVIQGLTGIDIFKLGKMVIPFFLLMVVAVVIIAAFPELATWLPEQMTRR